MKNLKLLLVLVLAIMTSCSKEDEVKPEVSNNLQRGVYICGSNYENGKYVPKYWVNKVPFDLGNNGNTGQVTSMTFNGNDLYAVGYLYDSAGINMRHVVWKNKSILYTLTNIGVNFTGFKIAVSNNDIYVMGMEQVQVQGAYAIPKIWKNGIATNISNTSLGSMPFSLLTKNSDIYIVGCLPQSNIDVAVVWENGVPTTLSDGTKDEVAQSISIVGNDIYVAGKEKITTGNT
jgi:hypothetical protein